MMIHNRWFEIEWKIQEIFLDNHASPAEDRDECGERINALFKNIEKFEEITGPIGFIPISPFYPEENLNRWW